MKWILETLNGVVWIGLIWLRIGRSEGLSSAETLMCLSEKGPKREESFNHDLRLGTETKNECAGEGQPDCSVFL
jgi:hypothetical protein